MKRMVACGLIICALFTSSASAFQSNQIRKPKPASAAPTTTDRKSGIDAKRIASIPPRMQSFVDRGQAAGIVTLVAHKGVVVNSSAVGVQELETKTPMRMETIFQIASMTKPITAVGIMILVEDGKLALTDPVQKFLPEFADIQLVVKAVESEQGSGLSEVRKPSRPINLRDLMTHTSGMGGGYPESIKDLFNKRDKSLAEAVEEFPKRPLEFEPGTKWGYSNMGIAVLGRVIEIVSGKSYEEYLAERIFTPLGMNDSHFFVPESKRTRIATIYRLENGKLSKAEVDLYRVGAKYPAPEAGLYSTGPDLFKFYQMMLNGGVLNGQRVLSRASVDLMTRVHTDELKSGFSPGVGFGLGWSVVRNVEGMFRLNSIGTYGHGGLYRTFAFIDPQKDLIGIILMQRLSPEGDMADEISAFSAMASAAVN